MAKIYRDDYGIPHIMATTSFDAANAYKILCKVVVRLTNRK